MANTVLLKKSSVSAKVPLTSDLAYGEVALNYADGKLYYKTSGNTIDYLPSATSTATLTNKTLSSPTLTGTVRINGITYPSADGTNGQVLTTDGAGNLSWTTAAGGAGGAGNAFTTIAVSGQSSILANSATTTLNVATGGVVGVQTNATTRTMTITTNKSFPFTKYDGTSTTIALYTEASALASSLDTVYVPFTKYDGTAVTTLKLT